MRKSFTARAGTPTSVRHMLSLSGHDADRILEIPPDTEVTISWEVEDFPRTKHTLEQLQRHKPWTDFLQGAVRTKWENFSQSEKARLSDIFRDIEKNYKGGQ